MSVHDNKLTASMPPLAPVEMPTQDISRPFKDPLAQDPLPIDNTGWFRLGTFAPAIMTTLTLVLIFADWFKRDGYNAAEAAMLFMVGFSAFWISLSVASATIGLLFHRNETKLQKMVDPIDVALLVPVYNEDPIAVFNRIAEMRKGLASQSRKHQFSFFVLSDSRNEETAAQEFALFKRAASDAHLPAIHYRRRAKNTERKTGNIRDWIENWGGNWPAFIVLDADSLMGANTINRLADEMSISPQTALIQTVPHLMGANTVFSRVQQFANNIYGTVLARGLDRWSGHDGNYWGHNAIIRTKAFANCAGLPRLSGGGALGGTIKSHDFVEAALLRRAGWSVRLMPDLKESFEETPQSIVDYIMRDRRWCQGNLQHLRLLSVPGLRWASRFHMLQGAMAYIASVVWFLLLITWVLMGRSEQNHVFKYFTDANPLFPQWPEMDTVSRMVVLCFMLGLLLVPKIFGLLQTVWTDVTLKSYGGPAKFTVSAFCEIFTSFMLAPILMVQHVLAVTRAFLGFDTGWAPQNRSTGRQSWKMLFRFHAVETTVGVLLLAGAVFGAISLLLLPIAISLAFAAPISFWSGIALPNKGVMARLLQTETAEQSRVITVEIPISAKPLPVG